MKELLTAETVKRKFSLKTFYPLIEQLSESIPDMDLTDWRDIVRNNFALTPEQDASMENIPENIFNRVQQSFNAIADHVNSGGAIAGKIILNPDRTHAVYLFLETVKFSGGSMFRMFRIAHCDANCENWGWG